ncbi:MAG: hypothetical protein ABIB71_00285 [Candidatus Woesearchaeota archaeon]
MKKLIIVALALILISGCAYIEGGRKYLPGADVAPKLPSFFGKSTITTEIIEPKSSVPMSGRLNPKVRITNYAEGLAEGDVCITGLDTNVFSIPRCDCMSFSLERYEDESSAYEDLSFGPYDISSSAITTEDFIVTAQTRYVYYGSAKIGLCLDEDNLRCRAKVIEEAEGPLVISSVEQAFSQASKSEGDLILTIELRKNDQGKAIRERDVFRGCDKMEESTEPEIMARLVDFPTLGSIRCESEQMYDDEAIVVCTANGIGLYDNGKYLFEGYNPETSLELSYGYQTAVSSKFQITGKKPRA